MPSGLPGDDRGVCLDIDQQTADWSISRRDRIRRDEINILVGSRVLLKF